MPLREHVYCVAVIFKMTEWVEQQTYIKLCIKLKHSSMETTWVIQKAAAMGNWWLVSSSQQWARSCIMSHAEFFGKTSNHPGHSAPPLRPRCGTLQLLPFPKTKITFERESISGYWWDSGKYNRAAIRHWGNYVRSQVLLWRGLRRHCPMYNVSCILYLFQ